MSNFDYDKALSDVKIASDNYEAKYRSLEHELKEHGIEKPVESDQLAEKIILEITQPDLIDRKQLIKQFVDAFNHGRKLNSKFTALYETLNDSYNAEINRQIKEREAERSDMWRLWRDRSIRWVAGALLAVLTDSLLVLLSDWIGFITIPVRDLVIAS